MKIVSILTIIFSFFTPCLVAVADENKQYKLKNAFKKLSFDNPLDLQHTDDGTNRIFVVSQKGLIYVFKNYGWRIMEGNHCYNPSSDCDTSGLTLPVWEYGHDEGGCSIAGGYVYRGTKFPELYGKYIYGDYCSGSIWALSYDGTNPATNKLLITADIEISSFGIDKDNEMYICDLNGKIYKLAYKKSEN